MFRRKYRAINNFFSSKKEAKKIYDKKRGKINDKKLSYRLKLINSARFMPDSLSNLVYKLAEEFNINWFNDCIDKLLECMWEENGERNTKIVNAIWNM